MRIAFTASLLAIAALGCNKDGADDSGVEYDRGCITVDDQLPGYAHLRDAVTVASAGATIALCGTIEESVRVDKAVRFVGEGSDVTQWSAPDNDEEDRVDPALIVAAGASVELEGASLRANYSTIVVETGGSLTLTDVGVASTAAWGIDAVDATIDATAATFEGTLWGGIHLDGGVLELTDCTFADNLTYGVGLDGVTATIVGTVFRDTLPSDSTGSNFDGWAIQAEGGSIVTLQGNTFDDNILGAVFASGLSTVTFDGDALARNWTGVWAENSTVLMDDVAITGSLQYDLLGDNATFTLSEVDLKQDPGTSPFEDAASTLAGGYGILAFDGVIDMTGGEISGHNGGGMFLSGSVGTVMPATFTGVTITDNAAMGGLVQLVDLTLVDTVVANTTDDATLCESGNTYNCDWALAVFDGDITWTGGELRGNASMGLVVAGGSAVLSGLTVTGNGDNALWVIDSALHLSESTFTGEGAYGITLQDGSVGLLDDLTFTDRGFTEISDYVSIVYHWRYSGWDVAIYDSDVQILDSTFSGGDSGIQVFGDSSDVGATTVVVRNTDFTGYNENILYAFDATLTVDDVNVTGVGGRALYCNGGQVTMTDTDITGGTAVKSGYTTYDATGAQLSDSETTYQVPQFDAVDCGLDLDAVTFDGAHGQAMELDDSALDATELTVRNANTAATNPSLPAVEVDFLSIPASVFLEELVITGVTSGAALDIAGGTASSGASVELREVRIGLPSGPTARGVGGAGIRLENLPHVVIEDIDVTETAGVGIDVIDSTVSFTGATTLSGYTGTVSHTGAEGVQLVGSDSTWSGLIVADTGAAGIRIAGGAHTVTDLQVTRAATTGIHLDGVGSASLTGFDVTDGGVGVIIDGGAATLTGASGARGGVIDGPAGIGVSAVNADFELHDVTIRDAGGSGLYVSQGTPTVSGLSVTGAGGWGMECVTDPVEDAPVFDACAVTALDGLLGANSGCTACE